MNVPTWLNLPHARYAVPVIVGVAAALTLFFGQRDLGPALMLAVVFLAIYGVARGTTGMAISRRYWLPEFWTFNLSALVRELLILVPIALVVLTVRRRSSTPTGA